MKVFATSLIILLFACKPAYNVQKTEQANYMLSDSVNNSVDSSIIRFIQPYSVQVTSRMSSVLAESEWAMEKGVPESRLGNFVADACMTEANRILEKEGLKADFAFFNNGGLRHPLPAGKITTGDVFELMPFENELVLLTLDGSVVKKIFNFIASKKGPSLKL